MEEKMVVIDRCEMCEKQTENEVINIELDMGFQIGDFANDDMKVVQRPLCMGVTSIYVCGNCKYKIESANYYKLNKRIIKKLKSLIKDDFIKNLMLEELREDDIEED